ncbi:MAG TPA: diguanylate cyclase [Burkholderiaceae bacterium]|nr:diguanylate cyclase [Burkholderiaceae bacterium]
MKLEARLKLGFAIAAVVLLLTSIVPFQTARMSREIGQEVEQSLRRTDMLRELVAQIDGAEAAQRGFLITGNEEFLAPYYAASERLHELRPSLAVELRSDASAAGAAAELDQLVELRLERLRQGIALRRASGLAAAVREVSAGTGKQQTDRIRGIVLEIGRREMARNQLLHAERDRRARNNAYAGLMVTALDILLLAYLLSLFAGLARARRRANDELRQAENRLKESLAAVRERNEAISLLAQLGRALEAPATLDELYRIVASQGPRLLPRASWSLYVYRNSRDLLELKAAWGETAQWAESIEPDKCWGLRRGQPHESVTTGGLFCEHLEAGLPEAGSWRLRCLPLIAHGEVLGLLSVRSVAAGSGEAAVGESMLAAVAEQLSLSISNMRLREALRLQSVVDPLTGLFNRRYLDETLPRELARATRTGNPVAVVMLDLDHFKRINDEHGHAAGDAVLRAVGRQVKTLVRASDVPCRYGGEELAIVLLDCGKAGAAIRSREILEAIREMPVPADMRMRAPITASLGVAVFPDDAGDSELLIRAADRAMYQAKHSGRNRVVVAGDGAAAPALPQTSARPR